jgi:predicted dehydrogenase/threonine dehydrogenase-like Zn-dependent dehydrogenase
MKQIIQNYKTGKLTIENVPVPSLSKGSILVKNHFSLVSAGTEKIMIEFGKKSLMAKAKSRPELVKQIFDKIKTDGLLTTYKAAMRRLGEPVPLGYSSAGEVIEAGEEAGEFKKGDFVACAGAGYASHAEVVCIPENLAVKVPMNVDLKEASFVTLGAIAMQGIRRCELSPGEKVAVIGLGLLGQITVQLLKAYGIPVLGIDINPKRVEESKKLGINDAIVIGTDNVIETAMNFSDGKGVDAVIITASTQSSDPLETAGSICRERGRISSVGLTGMEIPRNIYYEKELDFRLSRSYGPGRYDRNYEEKGLDYPIGYIRWTENRNMREFIRLLSEKKINFNTMITHTFKIDDAMKAYELVTKNPDNEDFTGILIQYDVRKKREKKITLKETKEFNKKENIISAGIIGGGNFARSILIPEIKSLKEISLDAIADSEGRIADYIGKKYGCKYTTSDYKDILTDKNIDMIVITTPHNLHAKMVIESLKAGKHTYVEKPLCLNDSELNEIIDVYNSINSGQDIQDSAVKDSDSGLKTQDSRRLLMVGFNRRFSPDAKKIKTKFRNRNTPLMIYYRVNAGKIPEDHWIQDPKVGGGRIIGEVCHFIDLMQFLTDSKPVRVYATKIKGKGNVIDEDNVNILIDFADGSRGNILYTSMGSKSFPKEYVEIFGDRRVETINNFKTGKMGIKQDKGHKREFEEFINSIKDGTSSPIPIESIYYTTLTTFKIHKSLVSSEPILID